VQFHVVSEQMPDPSLFKAFIQIQKPEGIAQQTSSGLWRCSKIKIITQGFSLNVLE